MFSKGFIFVKMNTNRNTEYEYIYNAQTFLKQTWRYL